MPARREVLIAGLGTLAIAAFGFPARAGTVFRGQFLQGALIRGRTRPDAKLSLGSKPLELTPQGDFVFGFAWDQLGPTTVKVEFADGTVEQKEITLTGRDYKVQHIDGLPGDLVNPPSSVLKRIEEENNAIAAARSRNTKEPWFADDFAWPVKGPLTGVYGSQRILNGVPKRPHYGLDIAAGEGKPVRAPVASIVSLAEPGLYFTGGTVILDHGYGVSTSYLHLSRLDVKVGDRLAKGDLVGAIGETGRATGPHLCWRLNWFQERLDPALVVSAA